MGTKIFEVQRIKCFPNKRYNMDKGTGVGMRKVRKDLQNENYRVYVGIKWITSWDLYRVHARQGLSNWVVAFWT